MRPSEAQRICSVDLREAQHEADAKREAIEKKEQLGADAATLPYLTYMY